MTGAEKAWAKLKPADLARIVELEACNASRGDVHVWAPRGECSSCDAGRGVMWPDEFVDGKRQPLASCAGCRALWPKLREVEKLLALIRTGNLRPTLLTFAAEHAGRISDSAKVTEALIPLLTHPKAYVREGALYGLRLHKTPDVCSRISELLSVEPIAEIREIASEILEEDAT